MQGRSSNFRVAAADMGFSSDGAISLFVNQDAGDDMYDGLGRGSPKKTISGALASAYPWANVFVDGGTYPENVIIQNSHTKLLCEARSGANTVIISPPSGKGLTINGSSCVVEDVSIRSNGATAIEINNVDAKLNHLHVSTMGACTGVDATGADRARMDDLYIDGNGQANAVGVLFNTGTNDAELLNSYVTSCGSGMGDTPEVNGYGVAFADGAQDCFMRQNTITDCRNGVYLYRAATNPTRYKGHAIYHNHFSANSLWDAYDNNGPFYQISIAENYYCYNGWTDDEDNDGYADVTIPCGKSIDVKPLANKRAWMTRAAARRVA
jgi:hypothetical protein